MLNSNISYTYLNPYDNYSGWSPNGATLSGVFFLNGISLGLDRNRRYEPNTEAPGGSYVDWYAPFSASNNRYLLYTDSYHQGVTEQFDGESNVIAYPICFQSVELTGSTSSDQDSLINLLINQQTIGTPSNNFLSTLQDPASNFEDKIKPFTSTTYSNEYLLVSTWDNYEYLAIWKDSLTTILDFGWESCVGRAFIENPYDDETFNLCPKGRTIDWVVSNVSNGTFFTDEKIGYCKLSTNENSSLVSLRSESTGLFGDANLMSLSVWFLTSSDTNTQTLFDYRIQDGNFPTSYISAVKLYVEGDQIYVVLKANYGVGDETFTNTTDKISRNTIHNIQVSINLSTSKLIVYLDNILIIEETFSQNSAFGTGGYAFVGASGTTADPPVVDTSSEFGAYLTIYSFFLWEMALDKDTMLQNYWVMKPRYS